MVPQYGETKILKKRAYGPPKPGMFAVDPPYLDYSLNWEKCREQFASRFNQSQSGLFFCHLPNEGYKVASFLTKTEEILDFTNYLYSFSPSSYNGTDASDVLWINTSRFWMDHEMRRQFLTILLRCGMRYDPAINNYEEALWGVDPMGKTYALDTKHAVQRFLFGFTKFIPDFDTVGYNYKPGWVTTFEKCDIQAVRKLLVKPDGEKTEASLIGAGKLWL